MSRPKFPSFPQFTRALCRDWQGCERVKHRKLSRAEISFPPPTTTNRRALVNGDIQKIQASPVSFTKCCCRFPLARPGTFALPAPATAFMFHRGVNLFVSVNLLLGNFIFWYFNGSHSHDPRSCFNFRILHSKGIKSSWDCLFLLFLQIYKTVLP